MQFNLRIIFIWAFNLAGMLPLLAQTDSAKMSFDFGWTRNKNVHLWPVFKKTVDSNYRDTEILFPIYRHQYFPSQNIRNLRILPLFTHYKDSARSDFRLLSLYYPSLLRITKDTTLNKRSFRLLELFPHLSFFELSNSRHSVEVQKNLFFLFWYKKDLPRQQSHLVFFPIYYHFKNKEKKTSLLLPLYFSRKDSCRSIKMITPLFWNIKSVVDTQTVFFPLIWKKKSKSESYCKVWPLFAIGKDSNGYAGTTKYWSVLLAFNHKTKTHNYIYERSVFHREDSQRVKDSVDVAKKEFKDSWSLFPIWSKVRYAEYENDSIADSSSSHIIFPFYWQKYKIHEAYSSTLKRSGKYDTSSTKIIFPFYWDINTSRYRFFGIQPFFSVGKSKDSSKSHFSITPFFWKIKEYNKDDISKRYFLFPIWWHYKSIKTFTSKEIKTVRRSTFFPLVWNASTWYSKGETTHKNVVFPFLWLFSTRDSSKLNKTSIVFPFYWKIKTPHRRVISIQPFFSFGRDTVKKSSHFAITPLFWHINTKYVKRRLLLPLYYEYHSKWNSRKKGHTVLFPLYWHYYNENSSFIKQPYDTHVLFPIYWRFKISDKTTTVLFPLYTHKKDTVGNFNYSIAGFLFRYAKEKNNRKWSLIWPMVMKSKSEGNHYFHILPLVWRKKSKDLSYFALFPLYYHRKTDSTESHKFAWEVFASKSFKNKYRSQSILWKTIYHEKHDNGDHTFTILYRLYAHIDRDGKSERSLFPFYHTISDGKGNKTKSVFFSFYSRYQKPLSGTNEFYKEVKVFWFIRLVSNYEYLKSKGLGHLVEKRRRE